MGLKCGTKAKAARAAGAATAWTAREAETAETLRRRKRGGRMPVSRKAAREETADPEKEEGEKAVKEEKALP